MPTRRNARRIERAAGVRVISDFRSIAGLEESLVFLDTADTIRYANAAFCRVVGRSREDVIDRPLAECDRFGFGEGVLARLVAEARAQGRAIEFESGFVNSATGETEFVRVTAHPAADGVQILIEDRSEQHRLESAFQRFVGPRVLEEMRRSGRDFDLAERREITILFADLRGFTALAQRLPPDAVRSTVNAFLDEMIRIVYAHDGMVDKIIGDEVMALFGAPLPSGDHAWRALQAAAEMVAAQRQLAELWEKKGASMPACGVGLDTGEVVIGPVGSQLQKSYTALGSPVNLAARLCAMARP